MVVFEKLPFQLNILTHNFSDCKIKFYYSMSKSDVLYGVHESSLRAIVRRLANTSHCSALTRLLWPTSHRGLCALTPARMKI